MSGFKSPSTKQNEVCFLIEDGTHSAKDESKNWQITDLKNDILTIKYEFKLYHPQLKGRLHSHKDKFKLGDVEHQEVTRYNKSDENDFWVIEKSYYTA